jgi:hypothetical protein
MADSSLVSSIMPALIGLGGTAIGAVLGFSGSLITQLFLEKRKQEFEKHKQEYERQKEIKRKKAEKLEELVTLLYDHDYELRPKEIDLLMKNKNQMIFNHGVYSKADAIVHLYFPELRECLNDLTKRAGDLDVYLIRTLPNAGTSVVLQVIRATPQFRTTSVFNPGNAVMTRSSLSG